MSDSEETIWDPISSLGRVMHPSDFVLDSSRSSFSQTKKNWPERLLPRPSTPQTLTHVKFIFLRTSPLKPILLVATRFQALWCNTRKPCGKGGGGVIIFIPGEVLFLCLLNRDQCTCFQSLCFNSVFSGNGKMQGDVIILIVSVSAVFVKLVSCPDEEKGRSSDHSVDNRRRVGTQPLHENTVRICRCWKKRCDGVMTVWVDKESGQ